MTEIRTLQLDDLVNQARDGDATGIAADLTGAIRAAHKHGTVTLITDEQAVAAAIVPADRCSACNRLSRTMRSKGMGVLWCGRVNCLTAIRELTGTHMKDLLLLISRNQVDGKISAELARYLVKRAMDPDAQG